MTMFCAQLDAACERENCSGPTNNNTKGKFENVKVRVVEDRYRKRGRKEENKTDREIYISYTYML